MIGDYLTQDETYAELATSLPALGAVKGKMPDLELVANRLEIGPDGNPRITIIYRDAANDWLHKFGPFDPSKVPGRLAARICHLKASAPFN